MSRSNPTNELSNPCTRWYEWDGENGEVRYYNKEKKETVRVGNEFAFMVLDVLSVIKGWHEPSQSGIISNEIRDTRTEAFIVRSFKGGELVEGLYADIKDRVNRLGGNFTANCYIAYRGDDGHLQLGSIQFKGAALGAWMEFQKANRSAIFKEAVRIKGYTEGQKGRIIFRMPAFRIAEISESSSEDASVIDRDILQPYLQSYFARSRSYAPAQEEKEPDNFQKSRQGFDDDRKAYEQEEANRELQHLNVVNRGLEGADHEEDSDCPF